MGNNVRIDGNIWKSDLEISVKNQSSGYGDEFTPPILILLVLQLATFSLKTPWNLAKLFF